MVIEADYKNGYEFWECRILTTTSVVSSAPCFYYVCCPKGWDEDVVSVELKSVDKSIRYIIDSKKMDRPPRNQSVFKLITSVYMRDKKIDSILK